MVKKTTIKDVAKKAGVSIATVSFVLNDSPGQVISESVKKKVFSAAKELNYHPSAIAAGLASKRIGNIAIIFYKSPELVSNQYYSFVVQGAIREAARLQYNLFFSYMENEYDMEEKLPKVVREGNTAGVLFIKEVCPRMVRDIEKGGVPVVLIDHFPAIEGINSMDVDNFAGGKLACEHLVELGHREIVSLFAKNDRPSIKSRIDGFCEVMESCKTGFSKKHHLCECSDLTFEAGYTRTKKILSRKKRPTAIMCANDELAAGALRAANREGLKVPRDLSITGFDNITMGNYTDPALTSIGSEKEKLGARAISRLLEIINDKPTDRINELLPVELVLRESTGPPLE